MANTNSPFGFKPVGHLSGAPYNGAVRKYYVSASEDVAIGIGHMMSLEGSSDTPRKCPSVIECVGASLVPIGPVVAIVPNPDYPRRTYIPASTGGYVLIADSPDLLMEVQYNTELTATLCNANFEISTGDANTSTGISTQVLSGSGATTATLPIQMIGVVDRPDNAYGAYNKVLVTYANHARKATPTGV